MVNLATFAEGGRFEVFGADFGCSGGISWVGSGGWIGGLRRGWFGGCEGRFQVIWRNVAREKKPHERADPRRYWEAGGIFWRVV
jgi:hypothetical protein